MNEDKKTHVLQWNFETIWLRELFESEEAAADY